MKNYANCPICFTSSFSPFLSCKDHTVSLKEFNIVRCDECGFAFTNPIPIETEIGDYYESSDYISHSNTNKGIVNKLYQLIRNYTIQKKIKLLVSLSKERKLLDIGSGTGEFLSECRSHGFDIQGIEPSANGRNAAKTNHNIESHPESKLHTYSDGEFDFITMWHVLEHVYHLNDRIEEIYRLLSEEGHLIIAVPNLKSYDAKKYGKYWAAYDVPRHLYHFSQQDIERLFGRHNFELIKVLPMKFDAYYVSMLSERYKNGGAGLVKGFINGLASNLKANLGGCSSQIYLLKKNKQHSL